MKLKALWEDDGHFPSARLMWSILILGFIVLPGIVLLILMALGYTGGVGY